MPSASWPNATLSADVKFDARNCSVRDLDGHGAGAVGTIVSAHPEDDAYTVEIADAKGRTIDLVTARDGDLRVTETF